MKKIFIILGFVLLNTMAVFGQHDFSYSQYMNNKFLVNPAFAGSEGFTSFDLSARQQWLVFDNAPSTQSISGQTRILKTSYVSKARSVRKRIKKRRPSGRVGLGAYVYNDQNGPIGKTGAELTYAYHIFINDGQLSLGLSLSAYQFRVNTGDLSTADDFDPLLSQARESMFIPDGSFGIFYTYKPFYVGFLQKTFFRQRLNSDRIIVLLITNKSAIIIL